MIKVLKINEKDKVGVAFTLLKKEESFEVGKNIYITKNDIDFGHKIALTDIPKGNKVIKYGEIIGRAILNIKKGEWVHIHNLQSDRGRLKGERINTDEI